MAAGITVGLRPSYLSIRQNNLKMLQDPCLGLLRIRYSQDPAIPVKFCDRALRFLRRKASFCIGNISEVVVYGLYDDENGATRRCLGTNFSDAI
jgi:hypothetical protein